MKPDRWLDCRVLVTVGTGGVGKTTIAAVLGLEAARAGKRALVMTIDPARRLADALGTGPLDHEPREVPRERLRALGAPDSGSLSALMLDTKRTFDELVERLAPSPEARERIFANPIYRNLSDALAGSREYSATEKLLQVASDDRWDLVVLDTPPAAHALDFLDAPRRLSGFLDGTFLTLLLHPAAVVGRASLRLFRGGSELVLRALERVTGLEFLTSISEFLLAFEELLAGFGQRAREVARLLREPSCGFVLVAGPDLSQAKRAEAFWERLEAEGIHLVGLVLNRAHVWPGAGAPPEDDAAAAGRAERWLAEQLAAVDRELDANAAAAALVAAVRAQAALARRDASVRERLERALPLESDAFRTVPLFADDVHAVEGLARIAREIFGASRGV
ncbi:MAG TPA: ArsA-related P-loop ATPase [Myxococcota bacterium]|nr:ArsA-related P-loop ATPase [Myxococcota bacterium]